MAIGIVNSGGGSSVSIDGEVKGSLNLKKHSMNLSPKLYKTLPSTFNTAISNMVSGSHRYHRRTYNSTGANGKINIYGGWDRVQVLKDHLYYQPDIYTRNKIYVYDDENDSWSPVTYNYANWYGLNPIFYDEDINVMITVSDYYSGGGGSISASRISDDGKSFVSLGLMYLTTILNQLGLTNYTNYAIDAVYMCGPFGYKNANFPDGSTVLCIDWHGIVSTNTYYGIIGIPVTSSGLGTPVQIKYAVATITPGYYTSIGICMRSNSNSEEYTRHHRSYGNSDTTFITFTSDNMASGHVVKSFRGDTILLSHAQSSAMYGLHMGLGINGNVNTDVYTYWDDGNWQKMPLSCFSDMWYGSHQNTTASMQVPYINDVYDSMVGQNHVKDIFVENTENGYNVYVVYTNNEIIGFRAKRLTKKTTTTDREYVYIFSYSTIFYKAYLNVNRFVHETYDDYKLADTRAGLVRYTPNKIFRYKGKWMSIGPFWRTNPDCRRNSTVKEYLYSVGSSTVDYDYGFTTFDDINTDAISDSFDSCLGQGTSILATKIGNAYPDAILDNTSCIDDANLCWWVYEEDDSIDYLSTQLED